MRRISWNWTKGGMMGGLRMAYFNVQRLAQAQELNQQTRDVAWNVETEIARLMTLLDNQQKPSR